MAKLPPGVDPGLKRTDFHQFRSKIIIVWTLFNKRKPKSHDFGICFLYLCIRFIRREFWQLDLATSRWKAGSSSLYVEKIIDIEKISAQKFNLGEKQTSTRDIFLGQQDILLYPVRTEPRTVRPVRRFSRACSMCLLPNWSTDATLQ